MKTKNILKILILGLVVFVAIFGISVGVKKKQQARQSAILITGLPKNQTGILLELEKASSDYSYIEYATNLLKENRTDEAVEAYKKAISSIKSSNMRSLAKLGLVDAYEKAREYKKATNVLSDITKGYKVPPTNMFRIPNDERLKYLEYAAKGDYDLAFEYAKKAAEADSKLPNRRGRPREDYVERLKDLLEAREYILSSKQ